MTEKAIRPSVTTHNRILRPASAAALPGHGALATPLKRAFDNVDVQRDKWIDHAKLAA
jgi:hypothetical protein